MSYLLIAGVASVLFILNGVLGSVPGYRIAPAFLIPLLILVYLLRRRLHLSPFRYGLFASALLLHNLGAYGYYQRNPTGYSFDMFVHFYFAVVGTCVLNGALKHHLHWAIWQRRLATVLFIMGLGACHEIMEYSTTLTLGEERGMVKKTGYRFDTERDLTCNLVGALIATAGLAASSVGRAAHVSRAASVGRER